MGQVFEGSRDGRNKKIAIAVARWNDFITERLLAGARSELLRCGVAEEHIDIAHAPGAFELPLAAKALAQTGRYDAVISLGCVIRGATPHFDYVAGEAAKGVNQVALSTDTPVAFGVLTVDTLEQAIDRAGAKSGNKGAEAAATALEMAGLVAAIRKSG
ncbi:MAG: 6,7-dimethyl-8-ribityllumazine synthase [Parvularculaceae bacterium]